LAIRLYLLLREGMAGGIIGIVAGWMVAWAMLWLTG
jgi:hypothetical protein